MIPKNSLVGRKAKLNNVNTALYKWQTEGVINWNSGKMASFEGSRALYSIDNLDLIDEEKPP